MIKNSAYTCPDCHQFNTVKGAASDLLTCFQCGAILENETGLTIAQQPVPDDWSVMQIGTRGMFKSKPFVVIGHLRLQLQRDYKNVWCLYYEQDRTYGWLLESLGSYSVFAAALFAGQNKNEVLGGKSVTLGSSSKVAIISQDLCEGITYNGEFVLWRIFAAGFPVAEGKNENGIHAFFMAGSGNETTFLLGEYTTPEDLDLYETRTWNEWNK